VQEGNTFLLPGEEDHLWMVISDPVKDLENVIVVRFLSYQEYTEQTCILESGDHPFVKHKTCVDYAGAGLVTDARLEELKSRGRLKLKANLSPLILAKIREAVPRSRLPLECEKVLEDQGLLE
jgi:hypothetical protein